MSQVRDTNSELEIEDVRKVFEGHRKLGQVVRSEPRPQLVALDGVSARIGRGETLGIVGESGSGKSTLAKAIVRLIEPDSGSIRFRGQDILDVSREEFRHIRRLVQLVYQDPYSSLNPRLKAADAILEPAEVHQLITKSGRQRRLRELLEAVGLPEKVANRRPRSMSGGQRQRVALARALAAEPEVLIADEVTSALDVSIQAQILNLLSEMQREWGLTMVFISHDLPVVGHIADEVAVMYLGRIVERGPTARIFERPAHPYTAALLDAQPGRGRPTKKVAVEGEIPSAFDIPSGCRFRTRCSLAQGICKEVDPPRVELSKGHSSWCHFASATQHSSPVSGQGVGEAGTNGTGDSFSSC